MEIGDILRDSQSFCPMQVTLVSCTDESSPWLGLPWAASEGGYEISQVLGPLLSDYSTGVNSCIHPKGAVFIFPPFLHESYLSLLPNMPFWGGILKKQLGECCGSPAIINNGVNTQHDLFITTKLLSVRPSPCIPSLSLRDPMRQHKGASPLLWVICGEMEAQRWSIAFPETLNNLTTQPGDHLLRREVSRPSCLLANHTAFPVDASPPTHG